MKKRRRSAISSEEKARRARAAERLSDPQPFEQALKHGRPVLPKDRIVPRRMPARRK